MKINILDLLFFGLGVALIMYCVVKAAGVA